MRHALSGAAALTGVVAALTLACSDTFEPTRGSPATAAAVGAAAPTPIVPGTPASGVFTVAFRDALHGILAGGDLDHPDTRSRNVAVSSDGGKTWTLASNAPFPGAAYGLSYVSKHDLGPFEKRVVITGPGGAAWSPDEGATWTRLPGVKDYWAVAFASTRVGWLVGTEGRILKVTF